MTIAPVPPAAILEELVATCPPGGVVQQNLRAIHDLCERRYQEGHRSFAQKEVGAIVERAGIVKCSTYCSSMTYRAIGVAWQEFSDAVELALDPQAESGHPDSVFLKLLEAPGRRNLGERALRIIYIACRARYQRGEQDFSAAAVARETEEYGFSVKALRSGLKGRGYGELILAWRRLSESRRLQYKSDGATESPDDLAKEAISAPPPIFRDSADYRPEWDPEHVYRELIQSPNLKVSVLNRLERMQAILVDRYESGLRDFGRDACATAFVAQNLFPKRKGSLIAGLANSRRYSSLINAWQAKADLDWIDFSSELLPTNPHAVFRRLRAKHPRADSQTSLLAVHRMCYFEHQAGRLDFSVRTIGGLLEDSGAMKRQTLANSHFPDLRVLMRAWDEFARPWAYGVGVQPIEKKPHRGKTHNPELEWVRRDYPELEDWRKLASEWLELQGGGLGARLSTINPFFEFVLARDDVPKDFFSFYRRLTALPEILPLISVDSNSRGVRANYLYDFLQWVLLRQFGQEAEDGETVVPVAFRNPVSRDEASRANRENALLRRHSQTVRSPLPYGYILQLRRLLAPGPNFRDWTLAQGAQGPAIGEHGKPTKAWYEVDREKIDFEDPDCVWRTRRTSTGRFIYQMWSPVRWVAVLLKLLLPLRTGQVRLLDSGESDFWKYEKGIWVPNDHILADKDTNRPWQQGVLRRHVRIGRPESTLIFANTNKTADQLLEGTSKGYVFPWSVSTDPLDDVFYWIEKLRDWQLKYNPIARRTAWTELASKHIGPKTDGQLRSYPDTCFLFRMPEEKAAERGLPITDGVVNYAWFSLLEQFQQQLAEKGETHPNGEAITFVGRRDDEGGHLSFNDFPLHSLRVSLITSLVLDGDLPFPMMQKLVGHSRLLMTLYYTVPGETRTQEAVAAALERMNGQKEKSIYCFLRDVPHERLIRDAISNNAATFAAAIPIVPADRNPAGWMLMHHGICLVGGNVSEFDDQGKIGGCYNGGPVVGSVARSSFGAVPGGSRNCVRCRWFVTEPHHVQALIHHFNNRAYHFDESRNGAIASEQEWQRLIRDKAEIESSGGVFSQQSELLAAERLMETNMKVFSDRAEDLVATWRLIQRCLDALNEPTDGDGMQLVLQGALSHVAALFEETESELLQLSGVCEGVQLYPDLEADKAVVRRSQLLDSALYNEGLPPIFMRLSEAEQLKVGNAFMKALARIARPDDSSQGIRQVIGLIDAGKKLGRSLGVDLGETLKAVALRVPRTPTGLEGDR